MIAIDSIAFRARQASATGLNGDKVASPCISVCKMNEDQSLCLGCFRTLDELRAWSTLDEAGKRVVWTQIAERAATQL